MAKISAFTGKELPLLSNAAELVKAKGLDIYDAFTTKSQDLEIFANVVSRTPALRSGEKHGLVKRDISTMVDILSAIGTRNQLTLPTRAILGRSFIIAKINFYYFILRVLSSDESNKDLMEDIRGCCEKLVFSLMAEEAYELIIENNLSNKSIVRIAADELSYLWEYRMDRNLDSFSPPLMALWKGRCNIIPVLGTLRGTMELLVLSSKLPDEWVDFLSKKTEDNMAQALEEFIFGLSHEEINFLREYMTKTNMSAVSRDDAIAILKKEYGYQGSDCIFLKGGAKEIYSFFHKRLHDTKIRKLKHNTGPMQTIEEHFLMYLLEKKRDTLPAKIGDAISNLVSKVIK
ncbi:MAG: hypothetical protein FWC36_07535 [Spirochaetes bacterium]|nr:hypothetical protein [Spirochaetota bacterium]